MRCRVPPQQLSAERMSELITRVKEILKKYQRESERRTAFSRSCGTVQERESLLENNEFGVDPNIILNRRSR